MPNRSPITLTSSSWLRFFTVSVLYFAQGVPWGFATVALVAMLSESGATPAETGSLIAVGVLPWTFKIFWAPVIDSVRLPSFGQRRPWIIAAQFGMALTLMVSVTSVDLTSEAGLGLLGTILFVHNCFASLQDVSTDALAIDVLREDERGRANGLMCGSKLVGVSAGGAGMAALTAHASLDTGMRALAAFLLVVMLLPIFVLEREGDRRFPWSKRTVGSKAPLPSSAVPGPMAVVRELCRALNTRATFCGLFLAFGLLIGDSLTIPVHAEVFTQRLGWSSESYSYLHATYGLAGKILGALAGGLFCDRIGARRAILVGVSLTAAALGTFALTEAFWMHESYPLEIYLMLTEAGGALAAVSACTLFMRLSWTSAAATQYTLYMTVANLGYALGPTFTRLELPQASTLGLASLLALLPLIALPLVDPTSVVRRREERARGKGLVDAPLLNRALPSQPIPHPTP